MDRINTKDMLQRRHWRIEDGPKCVLCVSHTLEDGNHLFFQCNFSCRIWNYLQIDWSSGNDMVQITNQARGYFNKPFFTEVFFLAWWNIWTVRNVKVFRHERHSFAKWRRGSSIMSHCWATESSQVLRRTLLDG